jgi:hypothetical protein
MRPSGASRTSVRSRHVWSDRDRPHLTGCPVDGFSYGRTRPRATAMSAASAFVETWSFS